MSLNFRTEEYYKRFIELQEKLRKSEEERLKLEMRFNEMVQVTREEEQTHYRKLRAQYKRFLEEDRRRQDRNERIKRTLERIESRVAMLVAKTERFKLLRRQYQSFLDRIYATNQRRTVETKINVQESKLSADQNDAVQTYLQTLSSQKLKEMLKNTEKGADRGDFYSFGGGEAKPIYANAIADDILSSIYLRDSKTKEKPREFNNNIRPQTSAPVETFRSRKDDTDFHVDQKSSPNSEDSDYSEAESVRFFETKKPSNVENLLRKANITVEEGNLEETTESISNPNELFLETQRDKDVNRDAAAPEPSEVRDDAEEIAPEHLEAVKEEIKTETLDLQPQEENQNLSQEQTTQNIDVGGSDVGDQIENEATVQSTPEDKNDDVIEPSEKLNEECSTSQQSLADSVILENQLNEERPQELQQIVETPQLSDDQKGQQDDLIGQLVENVDVEGNQSIECQPAEYYQSGEHYDETDQYDVADQPIQHFDESGQPIQQYDESGQPFQQFDDAGQLIQPQPDGYYQSVQQYDETGQAIQQHYDENGQPIQHYYDEHGQLLQYDEHGQLIQQLNESGQPYDQSVYQHYDDQQFQQYDESGQPIQQYDYDASQIQYDEHGQIIQQYNDQQFYNQPYDEAMEQVGGDAQDVAEAAPQNVSGEVQAEIPASDAEKKGNVMEMLDTDTESTKQDTKVSNDSDFDFSNA